MVIESEVFISINTKNLIGRTGDRIVMNSFDRINQFRVDGNIKIVIIEKKNLASGIIMGGRGC